MPDRLLTLTALVDGGVFLLFRTVAQRARASLPFAVDFAVLARALDALLLAVRRQDRMEVLSVLVHVPIVLAAAVLQNRLGRSERSAAAALVAHFVRVARANRFGAFDDLRAHLAAGFLVRSVGHLLAAAQRRALRPRAGNFQRGQVAGANGAGVVPVRRQVRMPGGTGIVELVAELAPARHRHPGVVRVLRSCAGRAAVAALLDNVLLAALERRTADRFALDALLYARAHGAALEGAVPHVPFVVEAGRVVAFRFHRRDGVVVGGHRGERVVLDVVVVVLVAGAVVRHLDRLDFRLQDGFVFRFREDFQIDDTGFQLGQLGRRQRQDEPFEVVAGEFFQGGLADRSVRGFDGEFIEVELNRVVRAGDAGQCHFVV